MPPPIIPFHHRLVNGSTGDPMVQVDLPSIARMFLLDCGFAPVLVRDEIARVTDVFCSHMHLDHWIGFDAILRLNYGEAKTIRVYGPTGTRDRVGAKLAAYTWNLDTPEVLSFEVTEIRPDGFLCCAFDSSRGFTGGPVAWRPLSDVACDLGEIRVRYAVLDHHIPTIAYAVEEPPRKNLDPAAMAALGVEGGPWCRLLKDVVDAAPDVDSLDGWLPVSPGVGFPIRDLARRLITVRHGHRIVYVTDCGGTRTNIERIIRLAEGADTLYIEAFYLDEEKDLGLKHMHLTAAQAAEVAREAGVGELVLMHFSKRYKETVHPDLIRQAQAVFPGAVAILPRRRRHGAR